MGSILGIVLVPFLLLSLSSATINHDPGLNGEAGSNGSLAVGSDGGTVHEASVPGRLEGRKKRTPVVAPLEISPDTLEVTVTEGRRKVKSIILNNTGSLNTSWSISQGPSGKTRPLQASLSSQMSDKAQVAADDERLMQRVQKEGRIRVIVEVDVGYVPEKSLSRSEVRAQRRQISNAQQRVLSAIDTEASSAWTSEYVPILVVEVNRDDLDRLLTRDDVERVVEDTADSAHLNTSTEVVGATDAWSLGFTGHGQAVAVLDSGVDTDHPFLRESAVQEACFSTESSSRSTETLCPNGKEFQEGEGAACDTSSDACNHGTHVSGIAVGKGNSRSGMAPDAELIAVQVFSRFTDSDDCNGNPPCKRAFRSDQLQALEYVYRIRDEHNIAAINMSLGGGKHRSYCDDDSRTFIMGELRSSGIATVSSAGNGGSAEQLSAPACISESLAIGSVGDGSDGTVRDEISSFSNSNWILDFWAPGQRIESSVSADKFAKLSGTSMSSPHVAGAWALLKSKWPGASVEEIHARLDDSGVFVTDPRNEITRPRPEVGRALENEARVIAGPRLGTVPPGSSGSIEVVVDATHLSPGFYEDTFTITSEGEDTEVTVATEVRSANPARAEVQPQTLSGETRTGKAIELEQSVTNAADSSGRVLRVQVEAPDFFTLDRVTGEGVVASDTSVQIEPQATATFVYEFQETADQFTVFEGTVTLETNDPDRPTVTTPSEVVVRVPRVAVQSSVLDFGVVPTGEPSRSSVTLTNVGSASFSASAVVVSGSDQFTVTGNRGSFSVPAGESRDVELTSEATVSEIRRGVLEISHNAVNMGSPITVDLQSAPGELILRPPYPNPLQGTATIEYSIPRDANVEIAVFDVLGRHVATLKETEEEAGIHRIQWHGRTPRGRPLADGAYFVRIRAGDSIRTEKLTILR